MSTKRTDDQSQRIEELLDVKAGGTEAGGCSREVVLPEQTVEEARKLPFTCPACHGLDWGHSARKRYLEHEATKEGGLERAASRIYWAKAGIERILAETDKDPDADD